MSVESWSARTLGDVATWLSGGTPSKSVPAYWLGHVPWVSPKDMKVFRLTDAQDHVSEAGVAAGSRWAPAGSVLIVVRGMILAHTFPVCLTDKPMAFNQDVKAVVPTSDVDSEFLAYWFAGNEQHLLGIVTEATHGTKRLDLGDLHRVEVKVPPLPEQHRIAEILDTLDEAIRKTKEVIAKLEQMKQGLLHDLLTRGIDENGELRDPEQHPKQFKDSPLGRIPREWEAVRVEQAGSVQLGRQRAPQHQQGAYMRPYLRVANVYDGYIDYTDVLSMNFNPAEQERYDLRRGDILLNEGQSLELVGRCSIYDGEPGVYCFQNTLVRFRSGSSTVPIFARAVFKRFLDTGAFMQIAKQTTSVAHLGAQRFAKMWFPLPPVDEQERIGTAIEGHLALVRQEVEEADKLAILKQGLMDDLLTGRVRVRLEEGAE